MHRKKIHLGGTLTGVALAPSGRPHAPVADVLPIAPPPPPPEPAPPVDSAETVALRKTLAELGQMIHKLRSQRRMSSEQIAQATVELAVTLAERLLHAEIACDRQRLDRVVRAALDRMPPANAITMRGNADDLALLEKQLAEQPATEIVLTFRPDVTCPRGQLKIEADDWFAEFDTERALTELRDRLREVAFASE